MSRVSFLPIWLTANGQYYDSVHLASDQKDLLISQLKAEIFEIQQRDKDYLALRD